MTEREQTCTDYLHDAMKAIDDAMPALDPPTSSGAALQRALECIERALRVIQLARADATAALDRF